MISLKKKEEQWWDGLTKEKSLKRFIKARAAPVSSPQEAAARSPLEPQREWRPTAAPAPAPQVDFAKWCDEDDKEYTGEDSFPGGG